MRRSPSMVPSEGGRDTYLVLEDLGRFGRVWRETAEADANHETLIATCWTISTAVRHASSPLNGYVTVDIADELRRWFAEYDDVPVSAEELLGKGKRLKGG